MNQFPARVLAGVISGLSVLVLAGLATAQTYSNSSPIIINDIAPASPYPSSIGVTGPLGNIAAITVTLSGFSHTFPGDCNFLLVAPSGQAYSLSQRCGGFADVNNITLAFSPDAIATLTTGQINPGTYRPSSCLNQTLPPPAPGGAYSTDLTTLFGTSPVGTWSLYVADQATTDVGQVAGGWSISFDAPLPATESSGSAFTYQGQLKSGTSVVNGDVVVRYRLFDAIAGGSQIGPARIATETLVDGVFTTLLDFGADSFAGNAARWLELTVGGVVLSPRQAVTAAPRALEAAHALSADAATNSANTRGISVDPVNRVGIGGDPAAGGPFTVSAFNGTVALDQAQTTSITTPLSGTIIWQSFTAGRTGGLFSLRTRNGVQSAWNATLSIYAGEGVGGALLASQPASAGAFLTPSFSLNTPVVLTAGNQYTFAFSNPVSSIIRCDAGNNIYAGGTCSAGGIFDLWFETYVQDLAPSLFVSAAGRVGINTTTPSQALTVYGNVLANNVAVPSSIRFKDKVYPLDDALEGLLKLSGVRFDWKPEFAAQRGFTHDLGFVAEEVEKVFPEVVLRDGQGQVVGMDYSRLTAVAVAAIKQQQAQIERLKADAADTAKLRADNAEITRRLEALERRMAGQR